MTLLKSLVRAAVPVVLILSVSTKAATLAADYRLQNTLNSSIGTIGALEIVGDPVDIAFTNNVVVNGRTQTVVRSSGGPFTDPTQGGGVQALTDGAVSATNYSVVLLARINASATAAQTKVFDFQDQSDDSGLYYTPAAGTLSFRGAAIVNGTVPGPPLGTGLTTAAAGTFQQITLTRSGTTGLTSVYQNGVPSFSFTDSDGLAVLADSVDPSITSFLTVFKDEGYTAAAMTQFETSLGDIARLRLYDGPLTAAEVAGLDTVVPEPVGLTFLALAAVMLLDRRSVALPLARQSRTHK